MEELTIKFGKGLCEPFTSSKGKDMMRIRIPNVDPADKTPWAQFVLRANQVHENQYGKGLWVKLPVDGETLVSKPYVAGEKDGRRIWENDVHPVPNKELKAMIEAYKTRGREHQEGHEHVAGNESKPDPQRSVESRAPAERGYYDKYTASGRSNPQDRESAVGKLGAAKKEAGSRVAPRPTRTKPTQMEI